MLQRLMVVLVAFAILAPQSAWALCGDGVLEAGEQCDDGRRDDGDGCSALCQIEHPAGCADGEREGFVDIAGNPRIAGCNGAWSIPGARSIPACERGAGDDTLNLTGAGCSAVDLCAVGWHVCGSVQDVANSLGATTCANAAPVAGYFATQVSGPGTGNCSANPADTNDNFGCGNIGAAPNAATCSPLSSFSNNLCGALPVTDGWSCEGASGVTEQTRIRKLLPQNGGVACCFGPTYTVIISDPGTFTNTERPNISGTSNAPDGTVISVVLPGQQVVNATVMGGQWSVAWPAAATALIEGIASGIEATAYDPLTGFAGSRTSTTYVNCGSGVRGPGEQCDDGNLANGDGCDATCQIETCGNGLVQAGEQCDDGGIMGGDGCSATCQREPGYTCPIAGGVCLTVALLNPVDGAAFPVEPSYSGTATPGALVTVTWTNSAGVIVATAVVTASNMGAWTAAAQGLAEGDYTITASVTTSGGPVRDDADFELDATAPAVAVLAPADGAITADTTPTLSGSAEPGVAVLVEVLDAGGAVIFSFNDPARTGMWSVDAMALPAGMYTVRATATDAAGNTASDSVGFMVDTSAPMLIVSGPTAGQTFGAAINAAGGLTVTGDVDADAVVMVTILDGMGQVVATGMAMVNPDGSFSFVAPGQDLFVEGTYSVEVVAVRPNNQSAQVQLPIVVDLSTFGTVMPDMDLVTNDPTPTFSGTGEPGASVTVEFDGAPACTAQIDAQGMWACTPGGELSGAGVVSVTITDAVGNTVTIGGSTLTIDTTAPPVSITAPVAGPSTEAAPVITGTSEPGASISIIIDGAVVGTTTADANGDWTFTPDPLTVGMHAITAEASDEAGNSSSTSVTIEVVVEEPDMGVDMDSDMGADMDITPDMDVDMEGMPDMDVTGDMGADMSVADMGADMADADQSDLVLSGGCAQSPAGGAGEPAGLLLGALGLLWRRRRR